MISWKQQSRKGRDAVKEGCTGYWYDLFLKLGVGILMFLFENSQTRQHIKKHRYYFAKKGPSSQGYGFFQWSCMDVTVGLWRKLSTEELMLLKCGVGEDSYLFIFTLQYCIGFAIHQHASATGVHVFQSCLTLCDPMDCSTPLVSIGFAFVDSTAISWICRYKTCSYGGPTVFIALYYFI